MKILVIVCTLSKIFQIQFVSCSLLDEGNSQRIPFGLKLHWNRINLQVHALPPLQIYNCFSVKALSYHISLYFMITNGNLFTSKFGF